MLASKFFTRWRAARLLSSLRFVEADRYLGAAINRWPDDFDLCFQHATCAHNSGRYAEAHDRWDYIRTRWPSCAMAWSGSAANLRELGKVWRARDVIEDALQRFSTDVIALSEGMRIYDRLGQTARSLELSDRTIGLRPHYAPAWVEHFARLLNAARPDEAAGLLENAPKHFKADLTFFRARIALREHDRDGATQLASTFLASGEARRREVVHTAALQAKTLFPHESLLLYGLLLEADPDNRTYLQHHADAHLRCGRCLEAQEIARSALAMYPDDFSLNLVFAHASLKLGRLAEANELLERLVVQEAQHLEAKHLLALARMEQAYVEGGDGVLGSDFAQRASMTIVDDENTRKLLLDFESLGQDCEFGLLQRHYGAEPLGLFRWNFIKPEQLRQAFDIGLAGVGEPEHTIISLWPNQEYKISDARWGFAFHTWITAQEIGEDELYRKMCLRLQFLKRKLMDELAKGSKVFVLKTFDTDLEEVRRLLASLKKLGPAQLLWVRSLESDRAAAVGQQSGVAVQLEPDLFAGFVTSFGNGLGDVWKIALDEWVSLCRGVVSLSTAQRPDTPEVIRSA